MKYSDVQHDINTNHHIVKNIKLVIIVDYDFSLIKHYAKISNATTKLYNEKTNNR